ncbi:MAG TPA: MarR family transcriptional regulator [Patescibacteria group bacterium]|nr:MarR family transcriptional regulator [Patescibacteria group bacterium]
MDLLRELGTFAFASRLKRLSDRLKSEATTLYHHRGADFNDSWFLVGYMLSKEENLTVTEMAKALGISRPAISQTASEMSKNRLISVRIDETDKRRKILALTDRGRDAVEALEPIWRAVAECTAELVTESGQDVLKAIAAIEDGIESRSLLSRVLDRLGDDGHGQASSG